MAAEETTERPEGSELLARISTEMGRTQKTYFGKGPESAKSYMLDDFMIVMRGSQTVAEETETAATARGQLEDETIGEAREGAHADDVGGDIRADSGDSSTDG